MRALEKIHRPFGTEKHSIGDGLDDTVQLALDVGKARPPARYHFDGGPKERLCSLEISWSSAFLNDDELADLVSPCKVRRTGF